jgi:hypothetical protein
VSAERRPRPLRAVMVRVRRRMTSKCVNDYPRRLGPVGIWYHSWEMGILVIVPALARGKKRMISDDQYFE